MNPQQFINHPAYNVIHTQHIAGLAAPDAVIHVPINFEERAPGDADTMTRHPLEDYKQVTEHSVVWRNRYRK